MRAGARTDRIFSSFSGRSANLRFGDQSLRPLHL